MTRGVTQANHEAGQWHSLNRVLNYLNTLDQRVIDKTDLYNEIMNWRPEARVPEENQDV